MKLFFYLWLMIAFPLLIVGELARLIYMSLAAGWDAGIEIAAQAYHAAHGD